MRIDAWMKQRDTPGTLAHAARQLLEKDASYRSAGKALRQMYFLELVLKHGGSQSRAAQSIGVSMEAVNRELRSLGIRKTHIDRIVASMRGEDGDAGTAA